jgi:hypothetical protein
MKLIDDWPFDFERHFSLDNGIGISVAVRIIDDTIARAANDLSQNSGGRVSRFVKPLVSAVKVL